MILDGLLDVQDIDPLQRHERIGHCFSARPMVPVIAENEWVKEELAALGFVSETIEEIRPVRLVYANQLSMLHTLIGKNSKLSLSGRKFLVARTMSTAKVYIVSGKTVVFLPYYFNPQGFYFSYDNHLLVEHFHASLKFLHTQWDGKSDPIIPFFVRQSILSDKDNAMLLELLSDIKNGESQTISIQTGSLSELLSFTQSEKLNITDSIHLEGAYDLHYEGMSDICLEEKNMPLIRLGAEEIAHLHKQEDDALFEILTGENNPLYKSYALELLWQRHEPSYTFNTIDGDVSLNMLAQRLYESATVCQQWYIVRRIADFTEKYDDRLEDVLLDIVTRQKRLAVGHAYSAKATFSKPYESMEIVKTIREFCGNNTAESVLTQEIVLHLGYLIRNKPELFANILTIRTWYLIQLLVGQISREEHCHIADAYEKLLTLAPHTIYDRLRDIMKVFSREINLIHVQENLHISENSSIESIERIPQLTEFTQNEDWKQWRENMGMIGSLSPNFYKDIWYLLHQCSGLVIGDKYNIHSRIGAELTLDSTPGERSFALKIDALLQGIDAPDYRQLNIELIESLARLFRENPDLHLKDDLIMDVLIGHAVRLAWENNTTVTGDYNEHRSEAWHAFYASAPAEADSAFLESFIYLLSPEESLSEMTV